MRQSILHYNIIEKLGEGGMGSVFLAEDTRLKRKVALKFLPSYISSDDSEHERLKNEAQAAASLNHPHIAQVYSIEESDDELFIVMEYIDGNELKEQIQSGTLTPDDRTRVALQVADALKAAHQKGIIHRDIKSSNIMIDQQGNVKIMDFGLARIQGTEHITKTGTTVGTTAYMSPEQLMNREVDERSDIWSFGVVLYELFTGELPFWGEYEPAVIYSITEEEPPDISGHKKIPPNVVSVIEGCLEKNKEKRFDSIEALAEILEGREEHSVLPGISGNNWQARLGSRKSYMLVWGPLALLAGLALYLIFSTNSPGGGPLPDLPEDRRIAVLPFTVEAGSNDLERTATGLYEAITGKLEEVEQVLPSYWLIDAKDLRVNEIRSVSDAHQVYDVNLGATGEVRLIENWLSEDQMQVKFRLVDAVNGIALDSISVQLPVSSSISEISDRSASAFMNLLQISENKAVDETIRRVGTDVHSAQDLYIQGRNYFEQAQSIPDILSKSEMDTSDMQNAIYLFKESIKLDPDYASAHAALGKAYWKMYEETNKMAYTDSSKDALIDALSINNSSVPVKETMGIINLNTGKYEEAKKYFQEILDVDSQNADAWQGLAEAYAGLGNLKMAEQTYREAVRQIPAHWRGYLDFGDFYFSQGNNDQAERYYNLAVKLLPNNYAVLLKLGGIYYHRQKYAKAIEYWEKSLDIKETYGALSNLATIYAAYGKHEESVRMYIKAIDYKPNDYRLRGNLASAYEKVGESEKANRQYREAIRLAQAELKVNPNVATTLAYLAGYYSEVGEMDRANKYIQKAVEQGPDNVYVQLYAAFTFEKVGDREKALHWVRKLKINEYPLSSLKGEEDMKELVNDPRFKKIEETELVSQNPEKTGDVDSNNTTNN